MRRPRLLALASLFVLGVFLAPAGAERRGKVESIPCGANGTISWTPARVWPPRGKDVTVNFAYRDRDGGDVTLTVLAKLHDQVDQEELGGTADTPFATDQNGGANSDVRGRVEVLGSVRSERSSLDPTGRTYRFEYVASQGYGTDGCTSDPDDDRDDLKVVVPFTCRAHDC